MNMKKMLIALSGFTLIILAAVIGCSIGVARLTKQTDTKESGVMTLEGSDTRVKVEGDDAVRQLDMNAAVPPAARERFRRLQEGKWKAVPTGCTPMGEAVSSSSFTVVYCSVP